jgi:hypothetical protein
MKKLLSCVLLFASTILAFAQGKVIFKNDSLHLVYMTTDTTRLLPPDVGLAGDPVPSFGLLPGGVTLVVDLWAGTSSSTLAKMATTTFSGTPGIFNQVTVALPFPSGGRDYFQVQVYDQSVGSATAAESMTEKYFGFSTVFTCYAGPTPYPIDESGSPSFSTWSDGLISVPGGMGSIVVQMNPVPEPSTCAFLAVASILGLLCRHRKLIASCSFRARL